MKDLIAIIIGERKTLLKALGVSFLLILPFTFLPAIITNGLSISTILGRLDEAILYSLGFSLLVLIVAVLQNYQGLVGRKWYFDRPAFKDLDFYGRIDGMGSIVRELETFLLGKIGDYFFRLNLVDIDKKTTVLEIVPLIDLTDKEKEVKALMTEHNFNEDRFLSLRIKLNDIELDEPHSISEILTDLEKILKEMNFESLELNEEKLAID